MLPNQRIKGDEKERSPHYEKENAKYADVL
jgi:hypothetical protein